MAIACAGYRVTAKTGHHKVALDCAKFAVGSAADKYADYFDRCRRKRNVIDYTRCHVATVSEANEIVQQATEFYEVVEGWIDSKFPTSEALKMVICGGPIVDPYAAIMTMNGIGHLVGSIFLQRWAPGTTTAPLLIASSAWLAGAAQETVPESRRPS